MSNWSTASAISARSRFTFARRAAVPQPWLAISQKRGDRMSRKLVFALDDPNVERHHRPPADVGRDAADPQNAPTSAGFQPSPSSDRASIGDTSPASASADAQHVQERWSA